MEKRYRNKNSLLLFALDAKVLNYVQIIFNSGLHRFQSFKYGISLIPKPGNRKMIDRLPLDKRALGYI